MEILLRTEFLIKAVFASTPLIVVHLQTNNKAKVLIDPSYIIIRFIACGSCVQNGLLVNLKSLWKCIMWKCKHVRCLVPKDIVEL